jgi:hypothetical protein
MPLFFFNFTSDGIVSVDDLGTEFPSLEAAYLDTCQAVRDISVERLRCRKDPIGASFEILDDQHRVLMDVPFSELLRPHPSKMVLANSQRNRTIDSSRRQIARSEALRTAIRAELDEAATTILSIRTNLSRLKTVRAVD